MSQVSLLAQLSQNHPAMPCFAAESESGSTAFSTAGGRLGGADRSSTILSAWQRLTRPSPRAVQLNKG